MLLPVIAEFIGCFIFFLIILQQSQPIPIAVGLLAVIYAFGSISGGHFNPAVTIMMGVKEEKMSNKYYFYIIAQILGGLCAVMFHKYYLSANKD